MSNGADAFKGSNTLTGLLCISRVLLISFIDRTITGAAVFSIWNVEPHIGVAIVGIGSSQVGVGQRAQSLVDLSSFGASSVALRSFAEGIALGRFLLWDPLRATRVGLKSRTVFVERNCMAEGQDAGIPACIPQMETE